MSADNRWHTARYELGVRVPAAHRELIVEPLDARDWEAAWAAYQGFLAQVRIIVAHARVRAAEQQPPADTRPA